jgi:hypothetical protein
MLTTLGKVGRARVLPRSRNSSPRPSVPIAPAALVAAAHDSGYVRLRPASALFQRGADRVSVSGRSAFCQALRAFSQGSSHISHGDAKHPTVAGRR